MERIPYLSNFMSEKGCIIPENFQSSKILDIKNMKKMCKTFNKGVIEYKKSQSFCIEVPSPISMANYEFIENYIYCKIFKRIRNFNKNKPGFSDTVYGEILNKGVQRILEKFCLKNNDTLFDMGSGIGLLLLQASATTNVGKVVGIELVKEEYDFSVQLKDVFMHVMKFGNFKFQENIEFINGNFFENDNVTKICSEASAVFIHDISFQPDTLNRIRSDIFYNLRNQVKLITVQDHYGRFRLTPSKIYSIEAILTNRDKINIGRHLSYCSKEQFLHYYEINRTQLNQYKEKLRIVDERRRTRNKIK
uniref:Histone-lysine N-methyltransferase, H3 lysine-79 specific n=1 Tax=Strongyloides papillosus TaxID=174720 RepID=A0A0N5BQY7_STREA